MLTMTPIVMQLFLVYRHQFFLFEVVAVVVVRVGV